MSCSSWREGFLNKEVDGGLILAKVDKMRWCHGSYQMGIGGDTFDEVARYFFSIFYCHRTFALNIFQVVSLLPSGAFALLDRPLQKQ